MSQRIVAMYLMLGFFSRNLIVAAIFAPEEKPTYNPYSSLNLTVISRTSSSETVIISSAKPSSQCGGINP